MFLSLQMNMMIWNKFLIPGFLVWLLQLTISNLLIIDTVRPDFICILILYWSIRKGRFIGTLAGLILGIVFDLSGTANFFGISPLIYSITGYLAGNLYGKYSKLNPFYYNFAWVLILSFQFLIYCIINYQEILIIDIGLFFSKWFGTSLYTIIFVGIFQFIYPLNRIE
tara:strand:- start:759 stop:1262 length:504 start_codon:yes stop_codon:yes gene_type:complete